MSSKNPININITDFKETNETYNEFNDYIITPLNI